MQHEDIARDLLTAALNGELSLREKDVRQELFPLGDLRTIVNLARSNDPHSKKFAEHVLAHGFEEFVSELKSRAPTQPWPTALAELQRRSVLSSVEMAHASLGDAIASGDLARIREDTSILTTALSTNRPSIDPPLPHVKDALIHAIERSKRRQNGEESAIPTPWPDINYALGDGFWPGLHMLVGGTGIGKTQWLVQVMTKAAVEGTPCIYVGLELSAEEMACRFMGELAKVGWSKISRGKCSDEEGERVLKAASTLNHLPIHLPHAIAGKWAVDDLRALCRQVRREHPKGSPLIVIDYLQLVGGEARDLRERVGAAANAAREMARELDLTLLVVSSTARANYQSADLLKRAGLIVEPGTAGEVRGFVAPEAIVGLGMETNSIEYGADSVLVMMRVEGESQKDGAKPVFLGMPKIRAERPTWGALRFDGFRFRESPHDIERLAELYGPDSKKSEKPKPDNDPDDGGNVVDMAKARRRERGVR